MIYRVLVSFLSILSNAALAASMNKCVDSSGHITFTDQACSGGKSGEHVVVTSASEGVLVAHPALEISSTVKRERSTNDITIVGGNNSPCNGGSEQKIRTAIVRNQIFVGMTAEQVTQSWGDPGKVNRSSRGDDQWVYYSPSGMQFVYVSPEGCVTAWN